MRTHIFVPTPETHELYARSAFDCLGEDGSRKVCLGAMSGEEFICLTAQPASWLFVGIEEHIHASHFLGFLWLTHFEEKTARLHFGFTRAGRARAHELGVKALHLAFAAGLQSIYGIYPASYRHIARFAARLGGACLGTIPASCLDTLRDSTTDGVLWVFTPETMPHSAQNQTQEEYHHG